MCRYMYSRLMHFCFPELFGNWENGLKVLPQAHTLLIQWVCGIEQGHGLPINGVKQLIFVSRLSLHKHSENAPNETHEALLTRLWINIVQSSFVLQAKFGFGTVILFVVISSEWGSGWVSFENTFICVECVSANFIHYI